MLQKFHIIYAATLFSMKPFHQFIHRSLAILSVTLTMPMLAQEDGVQMVLDAPFVRERYNIAAPIRDHFVMQESPFYQISKEDLDFIQGRYTLYPYSMVFSESEYWCKRVWCDIPLNDSANIHFVEHEVRFAQFPGVLTFVRQAIQEKAVIPFSDSGFYYPITKEEALSAWDNMVSDTICVKQDWWYSNTTGRLNCTTIGLGVCGWEKGKRREIWMYYPELRWAGLQSMFAMEYPQYLLWQEVFERQIFSFHIRKQLFIPQVGDDDPSYLNYCDTTFSGELDALYAVQRMLDEFHSYRWDISPEKQEVEIKCIDGTVLNGQAHNGMLQGEWIRTGINGRLIESVHFTNNIPHGAIKRFYPSGELAEKGKFVLGLREGKWQSWHPNGKTQTQRNYLKGVLDGQQVFYHPNGNRSCEFTFRNTLANGPFRRWYSDGTLLDTGEMQDGLQTGIWTMDIRIDEAWIRLLNKYEGMKKMMNLAPGAMDDGLLSLRMRIDITGCEDGWRHMCWTETDPDSGKPPLIR